MVSANGIAKEDVTLLFSFSIENGETAAADVFILIINPVLRVIAKRMKQHGKPHKLVIVAIARRLVIIANAVIKTGLPWRVISAA